MSLSDFSLHDVSLHHLPTPCLLLDKHRLRRNAGQMKARLDALGVAFRPHLKTAKSIEVARIVMTAPEGPAIVSTLREAEFFAANGVKDIIDGAGGGRNVRAAWRQFCRACARVPFLILAEQVNDASHVLV